MPLICAVDGDLKSFETTQGALSRSWMGLAPLLIRAALSGVGTARAET